VALAWGSVRDDNNTERVLMAIGFTREAARAERDTIWAELPEVMRQMLLTQYGRMWNIGGVMVVPPHPRTPPPPEGVVWDEMADFRASSILFFLGFSDTRVNYEQGLTWDNLSTDVRETLSSTYNVKWNADGIILTPDVPRREASLVTYRELEVGDIILDNSTEEEDRYVVVARLGPIIDEASGGQHGDETSVWGIWDRSVSAAGRKYLQASEGDLRPFIPGLMKRSDGDEAKYKVELKGIFRTDEEKYQHIKRHLEKRGTEVEVTSENEMFAWVYIPANASEYHDDGGFSKNAEVGGRRVLLVSSHPEIGLFYGDGTVVPVRVDIRLFDIDTYLPHRVDLMYKGQRLEDLYHGNFSDGSGREVQRPLRWHRGEPALRPVQRPPNVSRVLQR
jgi:hypothetical protein